VSSERKTIEIIASEEERSKIGDKELRPLVCYFIFQN